MKNVLQYKYIPKEGDDREYPEFFAYTKRIAPLAAVPAVAAMYEPYLYATIPMETFTLGEPVEPTELTAQRPLHIFLHDPSTCHVAGIILTSFEQRTLYATGKEDLLIALYRGYTDNISWVLIEYYRYANKMEVKSGSKSGTSIWDWI